MPTPLRLATAIRPLAAASFIMSVACFSASAAFAGPSQSPAVKATETNTTAPAPLVSAPLITFVDVRRLPIVDDTGAPIMPLFGPAPGPQMAAANLAE